MNDPMSGAIPEPRGAAWDSAGAPGRPPVARGVPHSAPVSGSPHDVPGQGMRAPGSRQPGPKASDSQSSQAPHPHELPSRGQICLLPHSAPSLPSEISSFKPLPGHPCPGSCLTEELKEHRRLSHEHNITLKQGVSLMRHQSSSETNFPLLKVTQGKITFIL